jgi:predicted ArsR family transcriptional regulator
MSRISRANGLTRQEIMTSIKHHGSMTAEELGRELNISQVAVRQHLSSLEAENLVEVGVERRGQGRPSHRYRLTTKGDETFPRRYDTLAETLLDELRAWQGNDAIIALLERRRNRAADRLRFQLKEQPLVIQVRELVRIHNEDGYMAKLIDDDSGVLRLVKQNCAVCAVARRHPETCCAGDIAMYRQLLGNVEIVQETNILAGDHNCSFRIRSCNAESASNE